MNLESVRDYCLKKQGKISEELPFGEDVLVFKVHGKMFLLTNLSKDPLTINLKCNPELANELRERYESVQPGYHQNKKHWNTVVLNGDVPPKEILKMIDHSYEQVIKGLSKKLREKL